ncbi:TonB-dependent receptor [Acidicapsa acidisoli]|uniref:TonB-dependent receptor n=1 Tax=Acidicapsa acidisoli TaxID=1615681 RepID=UPI0021E02A9F|nr:TonB-dependent receptor [Acidicapsa acidisoli]
MAIERTYDSSRAITRILCLRLYAILLFAILFAQTFPATAQTPGTGAISGMVFDPAGAPVVRASVTAVNEQTHQSRSVASNSQGLFEVSLLVPGNYTLSSTATGFGTTALDAVQVTASQTTSVHLTLAIASESQTVQVNSAAEDVELESSTLGGLVNETAISSLPLSNRNYTQILGLSPGVVVDLPDATALGSGTQNVASDGATPTANNIQFNGIDANNLAENSAAAAETDAGTAIPAPDTIQEFRVQTANFDAGYGRGTGANVDLVSKSGSNSFHGSAWEFVRNTIFNANDFFSELDGQPRPDLKHNQFGGAIGGPIRRDRTFFFASYQGLTEVNGLGVEQHPILPLLTSDRSAATLGAQFCPAGHLDNAGQPATGYLTLAGGTQVACDGSNINPVAVAILNAKLPNGQFAVPSPQVPIPNTGQDASDQVPMGQSTYAIPARFREDQATANIDQILTGKNTLAGRFFYARTPTTEPFSPNAANVPGWGTDQLNRNTMFVLADTHVLRANFVNVARFGYMRFDGMSKVQNPLTAQAISEGTPTGAVGAGLNAPGLTVGGFTIGDAGTPSAWQVTNSFIWQDTVALTEGRNNMRFGAEFKRHQIDANTPIETDGLLQIGTFDDFLLGQSAAQNGSPFGLSNVSNSTAGAGIFRRNERYTDTAFFVQDDIKLTPRLTLNAGLRYEIFGAPTETDGRLANFNADIAATGPVSPEGTYSGFTLPSNFSGMLPQGLIRTSFPGLYRTPHGDLSPRLGFVWQPTHEPALVLRGGYGVYFDRHSGNLAEQTFTQAPFSVLQIVAGAPNGAATLQNPFVPVVPSSSAFPIFTPRTATSTPFIEGTNPGMLDGRTQEYNLNIEYALGHGYVLQTGYVGTQSTHRSGQVEFDQAALASPQAPINGQTNNSINNVTARMPIQGVSQGSLFTDSVFVGNYNALQAGLVKHLSKGLQLQASYTWSKNLDEVNGEVGTDLFELQLPTNNQHDLRHASYGPAGTDRDQRAVINFVWTTPSFANTPILARRILSGWEFSGIGVVQSGIPLSVFDGNAGSVYGLLGGEVRAQRTGSNPKTHGSLYSRVLNGYLDPKAFTRAPEAPNGTSLADQDFGNSGVGFVRGPGQHNIDLAVERSFPVREGTSFRLRAEVFNLTNTPQFGNPNTSLGYTDPTLVNPSASSTFGKITSTSSNPRILQLAAKLQF